MSSHRVLCLPHTLNPSVGRVTCHPPRDKQPHSMSWSRLLHLVQLCPPCAQGSFLIPSLSQVLEHGRRSRSPWLLQMCSPCPSQQPDPAAGLAPLSRASQASLPKHRTRRSWLPHTAKPPPRSPGNNSGSKGGSLWPAGEGLSLNSVPPEQTRGSQQGSSTNPVCNKSGVY